MSQNSNEDIDVSDDSDPDDRLQDPDDDLANDSTTAAVNNAEILQQSNDDDNGGVPSHAGVVNSSDSTVSDPRINKFYTLKTLESRKSHKLHTITKSYQVHFNNLDSSPY